MTFTHDRAANENIPTREIYASHQLTTRSKTPPHSTENFVL